MKSGCFACDVVVEADDAEAIGDAFLAHAADAHDWDYPEAAPGTLGPAPAPGRACGGATRRR